MKIIYLVQDDWFFLSHRLPIALAASARGHEIHVITRVHEDGNKIREHGFHLEPLKTYSKEKSNPFSLLKTVAEIRSLYLRIAPDLVHHVALKPVLLGSLAASVIPHLKIINTYTGLGYVFSESTLKARAFRFLTSLGIRFLFPHNRIANVFQNPDDLKLFAEKRMIFPKQSRLIRGSGVDTVAFPPLPEIQGIPTVILASRMLWNKGIGELIEAGRMLRERKIECRLILAGKLDPESPVGIPLETIRSWEKEGIIQYRGHQENMLEIFRESHVICLPSYREGLPKVLLEAASCGRPIVATDVPGCREIVRHRQNGLLVPLHDPIALADAIQSLVTSPDLRATLGKAGRKMVLEEFSVERVVAGTMNLYREIGSVQVDN